MIDNTAGQLTLDIEGDQSPGHAFFLTDESNSEAFEFCDAPDTWQGAHLFLLGPPKSGKSLLAKAAAENGVDIAEDLDVELQRCELDALRQEAYEKDLFHRLNWAAENGGNTLITSRKPAVFLNVAMPDLRSRLLAMPQTTLTQPSDELFRKLLAKHFSDRQVRIEPNALDYLATRVERSHESALLTVTALDKEALRLKKKMSVPFIRQTLPAICVPSPVK